MNRENQNLKAVVTMKLCVSSNDMQITCSALLAKTFFRTSMKTFFWLAPLFFCLPIAIVNPSQIPYLMTSRDRLL